jgi:hypothetical protein
VNFIKTKRAVDILNAKRVVASGINITNAILKKEDL